MQKTQIPLNIPHQQLDKALNRLESDDVIARIWNRDHTVWRPDPKEITNRLGWLTAPTAYQDHVARINALAQTVQADSYQSAVVLGMGGSSLAPDLFAHTFADRAEAPDSPALELTVLDTTSPSAILHLAQRLDVDRTLFIVSTKSGRTVETLSLFKLFYNLVDEHVGSEQAGEHFVGITDPGSSLIDLAQACQFRELFLNDPHIGGRFSALSFFGLVPAALAGVDVARLLDRAFAMATSCAPSVPAGKNRAAWLGAIMGSMAQQERDKLTFVLPEEIARFGDWVEQLIAESLGKQGRGILPVVHEPLAPPRQYGRDRLFVALHMPGSETHTPALEALIAAGFPCVRMRIDDRYDLGRLFFLWELATSVAGHFLEVNPFDQPNVEAAKASAREMVHTFESSGELPSAPSVAPEPEALREFLAQGEPGDYIALQAFVPPSPSTSQALSSLRRALRARYGLATTTGYGPRFLHSTGQLHKGDAGDGLFVQFVCQEDEDLPIPDEPGAARSSITFGTLIAAQALGDWHALRAAGRRVLRVDLGHDALAGLLNLCEC